MEPHYNQALIEEVREVAGHTRSIRRANPDLVDKIIRATEWMTGDDVTMVHRIHAIVNEIHTTPVCKMCGATSGWHRTFEQGVKTYCSNKCRRLDPDLQVRMQVRSKQGRLNMSPHAKDAKRAKQSQSMRRIRKERGGTMEHKRQQTCLQRFGVEHPMQSNTVKSRAVTTSLSRYGTKHPSQSSEARSARVIACRERWGCDNPSQRHISEQTLALISDREWLVHQHHDMCKSLSQIARELNLTDMTILSSRCTKLGVEVRQYFRSGPERELCDWIESCGVHVIRNNKSHIGQELDMLIPTHNVAIEFNGVYWHSEQAGKGRQYHFTKWQRCKDRGTQLITIFEDEWAQRPNVVKRMIAHKLGISMQRRIGARKTTAQLVTSKEATTFMTHHHIQGAGRSSLDVGLYVGTDLVACMSLARRSTPGVVELTRFATAAVVSGGFSKLLEFAIAIMPDAHTIVTFADHRHSTGRLYEMAGFVTDRQLPPDYTYVVKSTRVHKFNFRHRYLPQRLDQYDPTLSEKQNCDNNGVLRVWDCGKTRYVLSIHSTDNTNT